VTRVADEGLVAVERYAAALRRILTDAPGAEARARAAAERARASFSLDRICGRYLDLYRAVSSKGRFDCPERRPLPS
jgi:glycosyltransferase involved in cell wall biosynthesis